MGNLSVYYQNVRGLSTTTKDLLCAITCSSTLYDVVISVETWLNDGIHTEELGLSNYNVYRFDRNKNTSVYSRGGGVMIAVSKTLLSSVIVVSSSRVEQLFVKVNVGSDSLILGAVYIPPASDPSIYRDHGLCIDDVLFRYPNDKVLLLGDYNVARISWIPCPSSVSKPALSYLAFNDEKIIFSYIQEVCHLHNLQQHHLYPNIHGSVLDFVLSNVDDIQLVLSPEALVSADHYHPCLLVHFKAQRAQLPVGVGRPRFDFRRANFFLILRYLNSIYWDSSLENLTLDNAVSVLLRRGVSIAGHPDAKGYNK